jgi:hypothetical protein
VASKASLSINLGCTLAGSIMAVALNELGPGFMNCCPSRIQLASGARNGDVGWALAPRATFHSIF